MTENWQIADGDSIGLFGLGNMGHAIAQRLVSRWQVLGSDPGEPQRERAKALGVRLIDAPEQLAGTRVVVLSLPHPAISRAVVTPLVAVLEPGSVVVETSTVTPGDIAALEEICRPAGVRLVDAAILSGVSQMAAGRSTLLVGGDDGMEDIDPILQALSRERRYLGPLGSGMAAKVVNNAVAHGAMVLLAEAFAMAAATGVPLNELADLLAGPEGGLTRPLTHRVVERVFRGDYEGGMPVEAARKDSLLALDMAATSKIPLFVLPSAHTVYELAVGSGLAREDYAAIAQLWEGWVGQALRPEE